MTDRQREELRRVLADEYRGVLVTGGPLADFIRERRPVSAVIEFDFLPDPRAAVEPEPRPFVIAEHQDEYQTLPAVVTADGVIITCWRPTLWEAIKLLFTRRVWLHTMTNFRPFQPVILSAHKLFVVADKPGPVVEVDTRAETE